MRTLNIFFPTQSLRDYYMKKIFHLKEKMYEQNISIWGVKSIQFQKQYRKIPGYWVKIKLNDEPKGEIIKDHIYKSIPCFWIADQLFFPKTFISQKEMEQMWIQKYRLKKAIFDSDAWKIFFEEGKKHLQAGRIDIAKAAFLCIYKNNPFFLKKYKRYYVFEDLAYYYEAKGELHESIRCLKIQQKLQPDSSEAYLNMSNFLLLHGLYEEGIQICIKALEVNPEDGHLVNNLIVAYMHCGYFDSAVLYLEERIEKYPTDPLNWKLIGDILFQIGKDKAAIVCYDKALSLDVEDLWGMKDDMYYSLAIAHQETSNYQKAIEYYEKFIKENEMDMVILMNLTKLYGKDLKQYDKALYYGKNMVENYPENGYGHHNLGLVYLSIGEFEKAKWHLYKAKQILPNYLPVYEAISKLKKETIK
ncbi:tetratricopeptide repeat protein [Inediibacterium massiliense]|uniref:tetratricopeptide repeat protein n=1 Tax=Inediibacterium massiliense TaxID=1658111 RepID=UPI0006B40CAD|nr:tetratricopeptide repeat protein [Inediibacterium massiliense]